MQCAVLQFVEVATISVTRTAQHHVLLENFLSEDMSKVGTNDATKSISTGAPPMSHYENSSTSATRHSFSNDYMMLQNVRSLGVGNVVVHSHQSSPFHPQDPFHLWTDTMAMPMPMFPANMGFVPWLPPMPIHHFEPFAHPQIQHTLRTKVSSDALLHIPPEARGSKPHKMEAELAGEEKVTNKKDKKMYVVEYPTKFVLAKPAVILIADLHCDDKGQLIPIEHRHMSMCSGCHQEISDRYILRVHPNMEFHAQCLKCTECHLKLDETCTAFVRNGHMFCKEDYTRLFATKCSRCLTVFEKNEMVMRARNAVFHLDCFTCYSCKKRLNPGEEFQIRDNALYCRADCEPVISLPETSILPSHPSYPADEDSWETSTMTSLDHTTSPPLSVRSPKSDGMSTPQCQGSGFNNHSSGSSSGSGKKKKDKQTTRVRTVLNENQLAMLRHVYALNSRPDGAMKEQLVEATHLSARVIRVWFQNKRCKDKKKQIQMRDSHLNAEKERALNGVRMTGVGPLIVGGPTTHIDGSLGQPHEITHFPQWGPGMDPPPSMLDPTRYAPPPMSYPDLVPDMSGYGMVPPPHLYQDYSPHLHASDLSSPSCSE